MNKSIQMKIIDKALYNRQPPKYQTRGSAGVDLRIAQAIALAPGATILVSTGIAIQINDRSIAAVLMPRSGIGHKQGLILGNTLGLIDSDYSSELMLSIWNRTNTMQYLCRGDRAAQMVFVPVIQVNFNIVDEFEKETGRGSFGSTGHG